MWNACYKLLLISEGVHSVQVVITHPQIKKWIIIVNWWTRSANLKPLAIDAVVRRRRSSTIAQHSSSPLQSQQRLIHNEDHHPFHYPKSLPLPPTSSCISTRPPRRVHILGSPRRMHPQPQIHGGKLCSCLCWSGCEGSRYGVGDWYVRSSLLML
jgi:hypothetical protein